MTHAARQQHAEVVPGDREAGLELAAAAQRAIAVVVFAGFGENRAERVLVQRIARPLLDGAADRGDRFGVVAAQAFDASDKAQDFRMLRKARDDAGDVLRGLVEPAGLERLCGRDDALDRGRVEPVQAGAGWNGGRAHRGEVRAEAQVYAITSATPPLPDRPHARTFEPGREGRLFSAQSGANAPGNGGPIASSC